MQLKGIENKRKRAIKVWLSMEKRYEEGFTVEEIVTKKVKKKNGKPYSRFYFYKAMKKLNELREEGKV